MKNQPLRRRFSGPIQLDQQGLMRIQSLPLRLAAVQRGVADVLRMHRRNNGQKVYLPEIDAGGRPETGILLGVA